MMNAKKSLSLLLVLAMLVGLFAGLTFTASAEYEGYTQVTWENQTFSATQTLEGNTVLTLKGVNTAPYELSCTGNLVIQGDGALLMGALAKPTTALLTVSGTLTVNSGNVYIMSQYNAKPTVSAQSITINGGTVYIRHAAQSARILSGVIPVVNGGSLKLGTGYNTSAFALATDISAVNSGGDSLYLLKYKLDEETTISVDGSEIYSGSGNQYYYGKHDGSENAWSDDPDYAVNGADETGYVYLWLTGENHSMTVGNNTYTLTWEDGSFSIAQDAPGPVVPEADTSWYTSAGSSFALTTEPQLMGLAALVNEGVGFSGKTITLDSNITLTGDWTPIGCVENDGTIHSFKGVFDGAGNSITGLKYENATATHVGLFGYVKGAEIKNLTVSGTFSGQSNVGGVAGVAIDSTFTGVKANVTVEGCTHVGGIVGWGSGVSFTNCSNTGAVSGRSYVGGILGGASTGTETAVLGSMIGCINSGAISGTEAEASSSDSSSFIGGLLGQAWDNPCNPFTIEDCTNSGEIYAPTSNNVGGIAGNLWGAGSEIKNSSNSGAVTGRSYVGGVAGEITLNREGECVSIISCGNIGNVSGYKEIGGIAGRSASNGTVQGCTNDGSVTANGDEEEKVVAAGVGGIAGAVIHEGSVDGCTNNGTVSSSYPTTGGIVGWVYGGSSLESSGATVINNVNNGTVTNTSTRDFASTGGIVAKVGGGSHAVVTGNLNTGGVTGEDDTRVANVAAWLDSTLPFNDVKDNVYTGADTGEAGAKAVTADADMTVNTAAELRAIAVLVNNGSDFEGRTVTLGTDIDLGSAVWISIGDANHTFAGIFDGNGKTVSNMSITDGTGGYKGLIGNNTGTVMNITVTGSIGPITSGSDNIGGVVGLNGGTVQGAINQVDITVDSGSIYAVGGVVGQNGENGIILRCANLADITASKASGGVCGRSYGTIRECYNAGDIAGTQSGKDGIGGIVGYAGDKNGTYANTVDSCYNTGTISNNGGRWHGGIAGLADKGAAITNSYDVGQILSGFSWNWNPIIGHVDGGISNPTASNNYSLAGLNAGDTDTSTQPLTIGTVKTEDEMKSADFVSALNGAGKAFRADIQAINSGYPVLTWQCICTVTFDVTPASASVVVRNAAGAEVAANSDNTYGLLTGETYAYEVSASGYTTETGSLTISGNKTVTVALTARTSSSGVTSAVQKPEVTVGEGGKTTLSADGTKLTITPDDGYEIAGVMLNGVDKGAVTSLSGLKTSDAVTVSFLKKSVTTYRDVASDAWYASAVTYVSEKSLMNGIGDDLFSPDGDMSRAMLVTVLYRLEDSPAVDSENTFTDVDSGTWYTDAVIWANVNGIVLGYGEDLFGPTDSVTREQMAAILHRYSAYKEYDISKSNDLNAYTDADSISGWAVQAMRWANTEGLITGRTENTLVPEGTANRAEVATILMRFCENIVR